ncbi:SDR family oxidoreductase [Lysinibacter cavernae]|uniref:NADP-dependent 3-hydroxy acid dehydrogenase YdfG n=1 Tax=Lysinibacter cavernae TaxID=1640652 RepID=A0A7X5TSW9_9MICO|nr:NADP-dependent 3-hydroxy acid dehydrogenase YdfG [Lysinibacter cavernae]
MSATAKPPVPASARPVAVVTGATGGMGSQIVADLARDHIVIALGRNPSALSELGALDGVTAVNVDVTTYAAAASAVLAATDRVDVLIHAAATSGRFSVEEADADEWNRQLSLNVIAPALLTRALLPLLRSARGTVVFINSGAGTNAAAGHAVYGATKHALRAVANSLRLEEGEHGVRVSTVSPGPTDTEMLRADFAKQGAEYEPWRYIRPESVAKAVRLVVDATDDTQITEVAVRPRAELV